MTSSDYTRLKAHHDNSMTIIVIVLMRREGKCKTFEAKLRLRNVWQHLVDELKGVDFHNPKGVSVTYGLSKDH